MKHIYLIVLFFLLIACNKKSACMPYGETIKKGLRERKTTNFAINDSLIYELDYVRYSNYNHKIPYCYGHLELKQSNFQKTVMNIIEGYDLSKVFMVKLLCNNKNICNNEQLTVTDIKSFIVYYLDEKNNALIDYTDTTKNIKETYPISNHSSAVSSYFLFKRSEIKDQPSLVCIQNSEFNIHKAVLIDEDEDTLYKKALSE
jgi:hypothetical protein